MNYKPGKDRYNGPHSEAARFFIGLVNERFKERPWNPVQELLIMRIFETTMDEFNIMIGKPVERRGGEVRLKNKQEVDAVLCAFLYFHNNAAESNYKLKIIAELHSKLMEERKESK